jgi:hypothetical protein
MITTEGPAPATTIYPGPITGHFCEYDCVFTPTYYATPACPTTSRIIGVEVIVNVNYENGVATPYETLQKPIYDYSRSDMPCYVCAMTEAGMDYNTDDFVSVYTVSIQPPTWPKVRK